MNNTVKKGTQSNNDVWVLHRTKDIKALVNAVNTLADLMGADIDYLSDIHNAKEAVKPFTKQNKNE